jgi:hypothetical protein
MRKLLAAFFVVFVCGAIAHAQPSVTSAIPSLAHGSSITIKGTGFGTKSPAAPLVWDSCTSAPAVTTYYDHVRPYAATGEIAYRNMQYRAVGYRSIAGPHARTSYYLVGGHGPSGSTYDTGTNVGLLKNLTSYNYFVHYYYRVDPLFDLPDGTENMKELALSNAQNQFYPNYGFGYVEWSNATVPNYQQTGDVRFNAVDPVNCGYYKDTENGNELDHNNPNQAWVKMQWVGSRDGTSGKPVIDLTTYPDNRRSYRSYYGRYLTTYEYATGEYCGRPDNNDLAAIVIGGFSRERLNGGINSFRYFSDVYIDITHARVMLGNASTIAACTILEPQPPSAWSDTAITVALNRGAHTTGTKYVFVINSSDEVSASYAVNIRD